MPRPDAAVTDLAALLHRHLIGSVTLNAGADAESWRTLLLLLARAPEEVRADGGFARLWATAGGPSLEIQEIDYAEVLRERQGLAATLDRIIAAAVEGPSLDLDEGSMQALLGIIADPARLDELMKQLEQVAAANPQGVELQTAAFLNLVRGLVEFVSRTAPRELNTVFERMGRGARRLSVEAMISLLAHRARPEAMTGSVNVVSALIENMDDSSLAGFVADTVVAERGASERLAHAFRSLVPERDRQRQLLSLARTEVAASELGREAEDFPGLWQRVEGMLTSYTDARYVSEDYARELSHARTQPIDVERTSDDPPERVAGWLATVSDVALRNLDHDLLTDLLVVEQDPARWRDIVETVATHADDLVRVGYFDQAWRLLGAVIAQGRGDPSREEQAKPVLERFGRGSMMKHVAAHLRGAGDESYTRFRDICHGIGPSVVAPLAEALASEQDARSRRRLQDILVGFGPRGRDAVRPLMNSTNWEVRRTAAFLLREFGGAEGLKELIPLLTDAEPLVRREAVQGLVFNGTEEACAILTGTLMQSAGATRETLLKEILAVRDDRAAPLFCFVLRNGDRRSFPQLYSSAIDALGTYGGKDAVRALKAAMQGGDWWSPFANRRIRMAAAHSLRTLGTPDALEALREVSVRGPRSARAAARAELDRID